MKKKKNWLKHQDLGAISSGLMRIRIPEKEKKGSEDIFGEITLKMFQD